MLTLPSGEQIRLRYTDTVDRKMQLAILRRDFREDYDKLEHMWEYPDSHLLEWYDVFRRTRLQISRPVWLITEFRALIESPDAGNTPLPNKKLAHVVDRVDRAAAIQSGRKHLPMSYRRKQHFYKRDSKGNWQKATVFFWHYGEDGLDAYRLKPTQIEQFFIEEPAIPELERVNSMQM